jgi:hypothetical protein
MEHSYMRVEVYRAAAIAACIPVATCPAALEILEAALEAELVVETAIQTYWKEQKIVWEGELWNRCEIGFWSHKSKFPAFPYELIEPEALLAVNAGTRALMKKQTDLVLTLKEGKLVSEAKASQSKPADWSVAWVK